MITKLTEAKKYPEYAGWELITCDNNGYGPYEPDFYYKEINGHECIIYPPQNVPDAGFINTFAICIDVNDEWGIDETGEFGTFREAKKYIMDHLADFDKARSDYENQKLYGNQIREAAQKLWNNKIYPMIVSEAERLDYSNPDDIVKEIINIAKK